MFLFYFWEVDHINAIIKTNDLSFYNEFGTLTLNAKQFDTGRIFTFNIMDNDEPFDIKGCKTYIRIQKADGTQFQSNACCRIDGINSIIVDTSVSNGDQILAAPGVNKCELHLEDDKGICLTTWTFNIYVEKRVHNAENLSSYDSFDVIDNMVVAERDRIENEKIRKENEAERILKENQRISDENQRKKNEQIRQNNENERENKENQRITNEQTRNDNETIRITNEKQRISNENQRNSEEQIRQRNENERQKTFRTVLSQAEIYATSASVSAYNAKLSEEESHKNATTTSICAYNAKTSEDNAKKSQAEAKKSETASNISEKNAATSASICAYYVKEAESWVQGNTGIRQGENTNNSRYWCQQTELHKNTAEVLLNNVTEVLEEVNRKIINLELEINDDGELEYEIDIYDFEINDDGELEYWLSEGSFI